MHGVAVPTSFPIKSRVPLMQIVCGVNCDMLEDLHDEIDAQTTADRALRANENALHYHLPHSGPPIMPH